MLKKPCSLLALSFFSFLPVLEADLMQDEIEHVVWVMLENRSFDNVMAWLYQNEAPNYFIPQNTSQQYLGLSEESLAQYTNHVKDAGGNLIFSSPPIKGIPSVASCPYIDSPSTDPNETFEYVHNQIFGFDGSKTPTMKGFLQDYANLWDPCSWTNEKVNICAVMETYTEKELPVLNDLAKHYAVSDLWFASVPSQTNPNRAFSICGTSEGQIDNGPLGQSVFHADTIWNRLIEESPATTWTIFWQTDNIPGLVPGPYTNPRMFVSLGRIPNLWSHYKKLDAFHDLARKGKLPDFSFIEPQWTLSENVAPKDFLDTIFPNDSDELVGFQGNDLHPPGDVRTGEDFLANIYTSLIANKEAWNKTLLIITFDEHGGIFDHVPTPQAVPPDSHFENGFMFDRYGVRAPAIFISPKINAKGIIRPEGGAVFDHTSLIAMILKWKSIDKSKWNMGKRVESAPTFESIITRTSARDDASLKPAGAAQNTTNVVQMGDHFYLKDKNGEYLSYSTFFFRTDVRLGSNQNKVPLAFIGGDGALTHGSFLVIQSLDPSLGDDNIIGTSPFRSDCIYSANTHHPCQWWTIKSYDQPYLGAEIHYGDRVYIENHIYLDPTTYMPARLTLDRSIFGDFLKARSITENGSDEDYWILEKAGESPNSGNSYAALQASMAFRSK